MILLSPFYFGTVQHFQLIANAQKVIIDGGEHYVKQSYRNRTAIVGPNGKQDLVAQVARKDRNRIPVGKIELSYTENWQEQHLHAIRSAYGSAPWFIHYYDDIEEVLASKYDRLWDLDLATMKLGLEWLGLKVEIEVVEEYVEVADNSDLVDLRQTLHPKKPLPFEVPHLAHYHQVFNDRHGFVDRLSVIDLAMNLGPEAPLFVITKEQAR